LAHKQSKINNKKYPWQDGIQIYTYMVYWVHIKIKLLTKNWFNISNYYGITEEMKSLYSYEYLHVIWPVVTVNCFVEYVHILSFECFLWCLFESNVLFFSLNQRIVFFSRFYRYNAYKFLPLFRSNNLVIDSSIRHSLQNKCIK